MRKYFVFILLFAQSAVALPQQNEAKNESPLGVLSLVQQRASTEISIRVSPYRSELFREMYITVLENPNQTTDPRFPSGCDASPVFVGRLGIESHGENFEFEYPIKPDTKYEVTVCFINNDDGRLFNDTLRSSLYTW